MARPNTEKEVRSIVNRYDGIVNEEVKIRQGGAVAHVWLAGTRLAIAKCVGDLSQIDGMDISVTRASGDSDDVYVSLYRFPDR